MRNSGQLTILSGRMILATCASAGAGGTTGIDMVVRAATDGYPLLFGNTGPDALISLRRKTPCEDLTDLSPISMQAFKSSAWLSVLGPNGLPNAVVIELNAAIVASPKRPDVRRRFLTRKVAPRSCTPKAPESLIQDERAKWAPAVREAKTQM